MRRLVIGIFAMLAAGSTAAQNGGDWPLHNLDVYNSRFSPLTQINETNAGKLAVKWQLDLPKTMALAAATPIVVNGVMYFNSGQTLYAVDGATGKTLWTAMAPSEFPAGGRGPAFGDGRIYAAGRSMIAAFDAETGKVVASFGNGGMLHAARAALDLKDPGKYPADFDPESIGYLMVGSPTYANGTLIVGFAVSDNLIPGGLVAAFDGVTGRAKWAFRTIPQGPQDDGWELTKDTWSDPRRYGGGIWTQPAVDSALNMVYLNVSNPSPNYDGSSRKGANLFTNSIVALDATTGKLKWHVQAIHHDIWDWDLMTGPTLFDVTINGKPVKALASLAKTCYVYALDRETGKPLFPMVETPVPTKTDMPGDEVFPTQPIPYTARHVPQTPFCATYPPSVQEPELVARVRPMFTPYSVNELIIQSPGLMGGPNRGSSSFSPRTGLLYVTGKNDAWSGEDEANRILATSVGAQSAWRYRTCRGLRRNRQDRCDANSEHRRVQPGHRRARVGHGVSYNHERRQPGYGRRRTLPGDRPGILRGRRQDRPQARAGLDEDHGLIVTADLSDRRQAVRSHRLRQHRHGVRVAIEYCEPIATASLSSQDVHHQAALGRHVSRG